MKIDMMTFSVNEKDEYVRFWEPLSKYIKVNLILHPVLLYVGKKEMNFSEEFGDVHKIYCGDDIPTYIPSTWGWFWIASQYPDKISMQSGIDMVVTNIDYFNNKIENLSDDCYVVSNADGYSSPGDLEYWKKPYNTFPSYYHIAKGNIFKEGLELLDDFVEEVKKINRIDYSDKGRGYSDNQASFLSETCVTNNGKWCLDELHSTEQLRKYKNNGGNVVTHSMSDARRLTIPSSHVVTSRVPSNLDDFHFGKPYPTQDQIERFLNL